MEDPQAITDVPVVSFKKRNTKTKGTIRKRETTPPTTAASDSDFTSSEDEEGRQIKRRRKNAGISASSGTVKTRPLEDDETSSTVPVAITADKDYATKASNWYDENTDHKSVQKSRPDPSSKEPEDSSSNGNYKGVANYQSFIQKNPDRASKQVGPVKSSSNVRTITVTDFAPDVCKDYKQTGFCGFGDSCKFLHAREDYKQGWELDKEWEIGTKGKKIQGRTVASANRSAQPNNEDEDDEALLESIPFVCIICKKPYTNPIVTKCGHYFCEACALKRYRKDPSCAACGSGTGGVFNVAKKLNKLLEKKRDRARQKREKALENGEEVSDEEEA